jgi:hypothetical protein
MPSRQAGEPRAWTTDEAVAEGFAWGHRGIRVPAPTVAKAIVPKSAVYGAYVDRNESEIVLDPERIDIVDNRRM